jgi:uncharacterized OsmC-like protein
LTIKPLDLMIAGIGGGTKMSFHHTMAANNTYDFNVSNETTYASSIATFPKTHGLSIGLEQHLNLHLDRNTSTV